MKKHVFFSLLFLAALPAFGQNRVVEVDNLGANYSATPPTVTFRVYWDDAPAPPRHRDTVWLFVDVQPINTDNSVGAWAPATIAATPAPTTTDGALLFPVALPYRGFYIDGDESGTFSATVTVALDGMTPGAKFNWCAYATDYPPNATIGAGAYNLHGTPPFVVDNQTLGAGVRTYADCIDTLTDATGCPGWIPEQPDITAFTASTTTICVGDSVTLTATATAATGYSFDGGGSWQTGATKNVAPTVTTVYTLAARNDAGCSVTYSPAVTVTVNSLPAIGVTATPNTLCSGDTAVIEIASNSATLYSFDGGLAWMVASTFSTGVLTAAAASDTTYYVAVKTAAGCSATGDVTIRINPLPTPAFINPPSTYCGDSTVTLTAGGGGPGGEYCFTYAYDGASHNPYLTGNDEPAGVDCGFAEIVCTFDADSVRSFTMPENGSLTVWVKVKNSHGCVDSVSTTIAVKPQPVIALTGPQSATTQSIPISQTIAPIPYTTTDVVAVAVEGLPAGMTYTWDSPTVTITGASTVIGPHPYTVTATGICGTTTAQGTITVAGSRFSMTSAATDSVYIYVNFTGGLPLYIDWGDGTDTTCSAGGGIKHFFAAATTPPYTVTGQARTITQLQCQNNQLTALDVTGCPALTNLYCASNQLTSLDVMQNSALTYLHCASNQLTTLNVTQNTALTTLNCSINQLMTLDVSKNTLLTGLHCGNNQLTTLDVSKNTALTTLNCGYNSLGSLDVSKNTALTNLSCNNNQLTTLNVTNNTELTRLLCFDNPLGALNVTKNTALTTLYCNNNLLTELAVTTNTKLIDLNCANNSLTALDVTKNTALTSLSCSGNSLTALDVSKNTAATYLHCSTNSLTVLDVTKNTALRYLNAGNNQLTALDVSKNTAATYLHCGSNSLTALDVTKNTALIQLNCYGNQLTALDVSKNTALTTLTCTSNQLESLDVSYNILLRYLNCSSNSLTALDVRQNTAATYLNCSYNQLTTLDVTQNTAATYIGCCYNQLTALDVTANTALADLRVQYNRFDAAALDALFGTLPTGGSGTKTVYIRNNPRINPGAGTGTSGCTQSLATGRGWTVNTTIVGDY